MIKLDSVDILRKVLASEKVRFLNGEIAPSDYYPLVLECAAGLAERHDSVAALVLLLQIPEEYLSGETFAHEMRSRSLTFLPSMKALVDTLVVSGLVDHYMIPEATQNPASA